MEDSSTHVIDLVGLFHDLVRVETVLWNALDARLRASDPSLTMGRFEVLRDVATTPDCRVQDVAERLAVSVGGISKLVDRLEASGCVVRRRHPRDRRSSILEVTPEGDALLTRSETLVADELASRVTGLLGPDALADLATTLHALETARNPVGEVSP